MFFLKKIKSEEKFDETYVQIEKIMV